ncbi:MAG: hypothetical protein SFW67_32390 [Myxococcaceae bacterium]|nr:hypothetical protein [Myxococcaceae bacterium]
MWRLTLLLLVAACETRRGSAGVEGGGLDPREVRSWRYRWSDSTGINQWIAVGPHWLPVRFVASARPRVLDDFRALDADVVTECASAGGDCAGDCLFVVGRFEPTLHFSELSQPGPDDPTDARWSNAEYAVQFELVGFEVLTPFRAHVWTGSELEARWAHGEPTTLEARHFNGRDVNPAWYRRARPR